MKDNILISLTEECIVLCAELKNILSLERRAVISFKIDDLLQNNAEKERVLAEILGKRQAIRTWVRHQFQLGDTDSVESFLPEESRATWIDAKNRWLAAWDEIQVLNKQNHSLIEHSQKNLGDFTENLKRLFNEKNIYSAKGTSVGKGGPGQVVAAKY